MGAGPIRALTGGRRTKPTSTGCRRLRQPEPGRRSTYQAGEPVQTNRASSECGYVIVPVVTRGESEAELVEGEAFAAVLRVLRALAADDERIVEYFRAVANGRRGKGGIVEIKIDEKLAKQIDFTVFVAKVEMKVWNKIATLAWQSFEDARSFARYLQLASSIEWHAYVKGSLTDRLLKPADIPSQP